MRSASRRSPKRSGCSAPTRRPRRRRRSRPSCRCIATPAPRWSSSCAPVATRSSIASGGRAARSPSSRSFRQERRNTPATRRTSDSRRSSTRRSTRRCSTRSRCSRAPHSSSRGSRRFRRSDVRSTARETPRSPARTRMRCCAASTRSISGTSPREPAARPARCAKRAAASPGSVRGSPTSRSEAGSSTC